MSDENSKRFIPLLVPGDRKRTAFSASLVNQIIRVCNAFTGLTVMRGASDALTVTDANAILMLKDLTQTNIVGPGGAGTGGTGGGTGNINFRGLYSSLVDYAALDMVYTSPDSRTRIAWVCAIANGPGSGVVAPAWPEPGSVYWRAISNVGQLTKLTFVSMQNDYIVCQDSLSVSVNVAKPPMLRFSVASRTEAGFSSTATISYASYSTSTQTRIATNSLSAVSGGEIISPQYNVGDVIFAQSVDHSGVTVSGTELTLIDSNVDQRRWLLAYGQ